MLTNPGQAPARALPPLSEPAARLADALHADALHAAAIETDPPVQAGALPIRS